MKLETEVLDVDTSSSPHTLVIGLDGRSEAPVCLTIEVTSLHFRLDVVCFEQFLGICEEEVGVGLEMNESAIAKELPVSFKEEGAGEALRDLFHLRVGEGEPYLANLVGTKETLDELDVCAEESYVLHARLQGFLCSCPHSSSFDVNANEVLVWHLLPKSDCIFASTTTQFEHNRVLIVEEVFVPMSSKGEVFLHDCRHRAFHHKRVLCHFGKLGKLSFAHYLSNVK